MSEESMSGDIRQQLSAMMDGELDRDSARFLLRRLDTDPQLKGQWERFHVARAALRRQGGLAAADGFAARVMTQLQDEAVPRRAARFNGWLKYTTGGAIAASVAVAALMLARPAAVPPGPATVDAPIASATVATASRNAALAETYLPRPAVDAQAASFGSIDQPIGIDPRLQSYLIRHYEAAGGAGRSGVAPYVLLMVPPPSNSARSDDAAAAQRPQR